MESPDRFLEEHLAITRRFFVQMGAALGGFLSGTAAVVADKSLEPALARALEKLEPFFTPQNDFQDVSRGKPIPHTLPDDRKKAVGLTRETWKLEILSDPDNPATLGRQLTRKEGTALGFDDLLRIAEKSAVRFPKVMTCLNIGCPLGTGLWEGVPLRDLIWLTRPRENLRRVFYHGYHNDDPKQMFRSSLPIGRVLEDPFDLPPVIVCYKLNGEWLDPKRGGPVRIVVPEAYGFKSVKWLNQVVLSNMPHSNDTYADGKNDIDSPLKSFAATLVAPTTVRPKENIPVTGHAQVGISGVSRVQVWVKLRSKDWPVDDPYFATAPWIDARILSSPERWGDKGFEESLLKRTVGFDPVSGRPQHWPLRLTRIHWAILLPGLPEGEYELRCRTVDEKGSGQPMPRPFRKSGHCAIETIIFTVKA